MSSLSRTRTADLVCSHCPSGWNRLRWQTCTRYALHINATTKGRRPREDKKKKTKYFYAPGGEKRIRVVVMSCTWNATIVFFFFLSFPRAIFLHLTRVNPTRVVVIHVDGGGGGGGTKGRRARDFDPWRCFSLFFYYFSSDDPEMRRARCRSPAWRPRCFLIRTPYMVHTPLRII